MRFPHNHRPKYIIRLCSILLSALLLGQALPVWAAESGAEQTGNWQEPACEVRIDLPVQPMDQPGLEDLFLKGMPVQRYFLTLDGQLLVAAEQPYDLAGLVMQTARRYEDEGVTWITLADPEQVQLCYGKVSALANTDMDSARTRLEDALKVRTVAEDRRLETIPFETVTLKDNTRDASLPPEVTTAGREGVRQIITSTSFVNGALDGVEMTEEVLEEPVQQIETVGTWVAPEPEPVVEQPEYIWPCEGRISSRFGHRNIKVGSSDHKGIDIAVDVGTDVRAAKAGVVTYAGWANGYGYLVKLQHEDGDETYYGHNSLLLVREGDTVEQGAVIACSGSTGRSTGPHLHFEIRLYGTPMNPLNYLPER